MRGDHLKKTFLKERILPLLFNKKSATIFRSARNALESHDTTVNGLQEQYDSTSKTDDNFWESVADIISDAYDVSFSDFSEIEFEDFMRELLDARFDKEFRVNDIRKLDVGTAIDDFLSEINEGDNIVLNSDDSDPRIIYVGEKNSREYVEPLRPTEEEYYPPLLLEINEDDDEIRLSGNKTQRNRFVYATHDYDNIVLQDEEPDSYDDLDIDPLFVQKLKSHDMFLRAIRISGGNSNISLSVSSGEGVIEVQEFVDYDLLIQNKQDLLAVDKCKFIYVTEEEDVEFELNFQTFSRTSDNQEFIKISLEVAETEQETRETIEDILERYGIEVYEPYHKPPSYYFNKILTTHKNYRQKYYDSLQNIKSSTEIDKLVDKNIINPDSEEKHIPLNKETLMKEIHSILSDATGEDIEIGGRQHRIADIEEPEESRIQLTVKSYSDDAEDSHRRFYTVIIPFRARPDKFEKIYNIILTQVNYHQILTSESHTDVVRYIVRATQRKLRYQQEMLVEKEARRSVKILQDYYPEPEQFRESYDSKQQAGYDIEDHVNVVLRYLFRDYIHEGGKNEADGRLKLKNNHYLIDSKQSESIPQTQLTKSKQDLEDSGSNVFIESERMVFVVSKELLFSNTESGSLNKDARERIERDTDFSFHFISVEAISTLYDIFSENTNIISSNSKAYGEILSHVQSMIDESQFSEDCEDLTENEDEYIAKIRRTIDDSDYIPEDRYRYF